MSENLETNERLFLVSPDAKDVSVLILQRVPEDKIELFHEWQRGISVAAGRYPGYVSTAVNPPVPGRQDAWVTIVSFRSIEQLEAWIQSIERQEWVQRYEKEFGHFEITHFGGGFQHWFHQSDVTQPAPPNWKMALTVLAALYPTVMVLSLFVVPYLPKWPMAVVMLIGNAMCVCLLQWIIMPWWTRFLKSWLPPTRISGWARTLVGTLGLLVFISLWVAFFYFYGKSY